MHRQPTDGQLEPIAAAIGGKVLSVSRIFYEVGQLVDESNGALELAFHGGLTIHLDSGSDGDSLRIDQTAWIDPFVEPLSPVNRAFVEQSGKWSKIDLSNTGGYSHLAGAVLLDFEPAYFEDGRLVGLTLRFDNGSFVKAQTVADKLIVDLA